MPPDAHRDRVLILDFGSQFTQLIARRIRERGVYCEIHPCHVALDVVRAFAPKGIVLSGGPSSVLDERVVGGLDVYAGGFTAEYGDRMSAIIDARSLRPAAEEYYELGLSLMHATALASP